MITYKYRCGCTGTDATCPIHGRSIHSMEFSPIAFCDHFRLAARERDSKEREEKEFPLDRRE